MGTNATEDMQDTESTQSYIPLLASEWRKRKTRNGQFSLRAFARFLEMSPSLLSQLLSGKRRLTRKQALKIANRLDFSPAERNRLLIGPYSETAGLLDERRLLEEDQFNLISDWYHYAILGLASLESNSSSPKWISRRLGISEIIATDALRRLKRLKLIEIKDGSFRQVTKPLDAGWNAPSAALRRHHKQNMDLAKEKIDTVDLSKREYSSITMAANPIQLKKAKDLIAEFKYRLSKILEQGERTEVYTLSVQLFPVTTLDSEEKSPK